MYETTPIAAIQGDHVDDHEPTQSDDLVHAAQQLLQRCQTLLDGLDDARTSATGLSTHSTLRAKKQQGVEGLNKFKNLIKAELQFLQKLLLSPQLIKPAHVRCSNLIYFEALYALFRSHVSQVSAVLKTFTFTSSSAKKVGGVCHGQRANVRVDMVLDGGRVWVKVKASKSGGELEHEDDSTDEEEEEEDVDDGCSDNTGHAHGDDKKSDSNGLLINATDDALETTPFLKQVKQLLAAANEHKLHFIQPQVIIYFPSQPNSADSQSDLGGVDERLIERLSKLGVCVAVGPWDPASTLTSMPSITSPTELPSASIHRFPTTNSEMMLTSTVNLDVTTLICLVSDLTNRFNRVPEETYDIPALISQRAEEQQEPALKTILPILQTRSIVVTSAGLSKALSILHLIGGPRERRRTERLLDPTSPQPDLLSEIQKTLWSHTNCTDLLRLQTETDLDIEQNDTHVSQMPWFKIRVVPSNPSERFVDLLSSAGKKKNGLKLNEMQVSIFGTADREKWTTLTANSGLQRSLETNGVFGVGLYVHGPRSLVEGRVEMVRRKKEARNDGKMSHCISTGSSC
ncbi:hypothetical protein HDV05_005090 [Chytridiales sp. JEL 0842]|nr:hypothetical protein HDV05_005090 [Chytridiales sp. JEL 0842]